MAKTVSQGSPFKAGQFEALKSQPETAFQPTHEAIMLWASLIS